MKNWKNWHFALLSGLLVGVSYIPFPPFFLVFCLIPLFHAWKQSQNPKEMFKYGWIASFLLSLIGFHWVAHTAAEFGHLPNWISYLVLIVFCSFNALHFAIAGWLVGKFKLFKTDTLSQSILISFIVFICEFLYPMIFPWHLGYPWLYSGFPLYKMANIIGFEGLSFFTIFFNFLIYQSILHRKNLRVLFQIQKRNPILYLLSILIALSFVTDKPMKTSTKLKALVVQANIGNLEKAQAERGSAFRSIIINKYLDLTKAYLKEDREVDFIVWPETAMPIFLDPGQPPSRHLSYLQQQISQLNKPVYTGIYSSKGEKIFNSTVIFDETGKTVDYYFKSILLAFGEYIPGTNYIPALKKFVEKYIPAISHFGRGDGPKIMKLGHAKIGPQICYEGLYPDFTRKLTNKGANIFINLTNDSWFGDTFEPYQHMYMTLARAVEFKRPLIRATNTGFTTVALPSGKVLEMSPLHKEWAHKYEIPIELEPPNSIYQGIGKLFPLLILLLSLIRQYHGKREQ